MDKYTITQFNKQFPNDNACLEWIMRHKYPDGIHCSFCGKITKHYKITSRQSYACDLCGHHVHPMVDTIFEKSTTPLKQWFYAMFLISATRCGISAKQLQRELGVTYKTAWRMFFQIRYLMNENCKPLDNTVELDETYIGARKHGKRGRGAAGKASIFGMVERKGDIQAVVTKDLKRTTLYPIIKEHVLPKSMIYTDEFQSYTGLSQEGYGHKRVHHASKVYVSGDVHTNTIEGFWSLLKGGISGVYKAVGQKHLQHYVDEYAFRYNHRKDERPMFLTVLEQV
jgi:transposase-like protein